VLPTQRRKGFLLLGVGTARKVADITIDRSQAKALDLRVGLRRRRGRRVLNPVQSA